MNDMDEDDHEADGDDAPAPATVTGMILALDAQVRDALIKRSPEPAAHLVAPARMEHDGGEAMACERGNALHLRRIRALRRRASSKAMCPGLRMVRGRDRAAQAFGQAVANTVPYGPLTDCGVTT